MGTSYPGNTVEVHHAMMNEERVSTSLDMNVSKKKFFCISINKITCFPCNLSLVYC